MQHASTQYAGLMAKHRVHICVRAQDFGEESTRQGNRHQ